MTPTALFAAGDMPVEIYAAAARPLRERVEELARAQQRRHPGCDYDEPWGGGDDPGAHQRTTSCWVRGTG
ncbi:MAG: hypothetical protein ACRDQD_31740 [Nocardioidaceae bacterium]